MFTTSVLGYAYASKEKPQQVAIIWRRRYDPDHQVVAWDFFTRSPIEEAESIVATDAFLTGLDRSCYDIKQG